MTFHYLTVLERAGSRQDSLNAKARTPTWMCKCICGKDVVVIGKRLKKGTTKSCGCKNYKSRSGYKYGLENGVGQLIGRYKNDAKRRNLNWELTFEDFRLLTQKNCTYCGQVPSSVHKYKLANKHYPEKDYIYNGIDRWDNSIGYTLENCISCCKVCNRAKSDMDAEAFLDWAVRIYKCLTGET